jgi:hypothetical protein
LNESTKSTSAISFPKFRMTNWTPNLSTISRISSQRNKISSSAIQHWWKLLWSSSQSPPWEFQFILLVFPIYQHSCGKRGRSIPMSFILIA